MKKIILILIFFPAFVFAQSTTNLLRSTISYSGSSIITSNNFLVQQSVGQNSPIGLQEFSDKVARQGFIQPSILRRMMVSSKYSDLSVEVFPNPTIDKITLTFSKIFVGKISLSIYDQMGRLVLESDYESQLEVSLSLADLRVGNYFLKVNISNQQYVTQITKQQ
tara:strand:+ start:156 stop:650 length:495 start_codon:yes stop_codon:yes gene_type:complete